MSCSVNEKRINTDLMKLIEKYEVNLYGNSKMEFTVMFHGPKDTPYENGIWAISVYLPKEYPFKSPSIAFKNKIYHPNVDISSGSICLDVINQTWTALYDLRHVFDWFLPQLLAYPNPADPINPHAAKIFHQTVEYEKVCREFVKRYASEDMARSHFSTSTPSTSTAMETDSSSASSSDSESSLSELSCDGDNA